MRYIENSEYKDFERLATVVVTLGISISCVDCVFDDFKSQQVMMLYS